MVKSILAIEKNNSWLELSLRVVLGTLFIIASLHKIGNPQAFASVIRGYDLFPSFAINFFAVTIPYLELVAGLCMVCGFWPKAGAWLVCLMLVAYLSAVGINLIRGHEFDCGCFSFGHSGSGWQTLTQDIVGLAMVVWVIRYPGKPRLVFCE